MQFRDREVVRVAERALLIGPGTQASGDMTSHGMDVGAGYYLALWPRRGRSKRRRVWLRYFGPFQSRVEARFLVSSALAMGLIEPSSSEGEPAAGGAEVDPGNRPMHRPAYSGDTAAAAPS